MLKFHSLVKKNTFLNKRFIQSVNPTFEKKILKIKCQFKDGANLHSGLSQETIKNTRKRVGDYIHYFMYIYLFFHFSDKLLDIQNYYEAKNSVDDYKTTGNKVKPTTPHPK